MGSCPVEVLDGSEEFTNGRETHGGIQINFKGGKPVLAYPQPKFRSLACTFSPYSSPVSSISKILS